MTTPPTRSLVIERELPHPPEKVWRALTQGPLIKEWLMDNDFQPVVGHRLAATGGGTHLRMEQSGLRPDQEANYKGANYGWQKLIGNLERVVGGLQS